MNAKAKTEDAAPAGGADLDDAIKMATGEKGMSSEQKGSGGAENDTPTEEDRIARGDVVKTADAKKTEPEKTDAEPEKTDAKKTDTDKSESDGVYMPKARYDFKARQARELSDENLRLKSELAELKATKAANSASTVQESTEPMARVDSRLAELDDEMVAAIADNDLAKVKQLRAEERSLIAERSDMVASTRSTEAATRTRQDIEYDAALVSYEAEYPFLNPDLEGYDAEVAAEIADLYNALAESGRYNAVNALHRAISLVVTPDIIRAHAAAPAAGGEKRPAKTDVKRNLDTARRQPANIDDVGRDTDAAGDDHGKINVEAMTDEEFDALPEATKRKLRGDVVVAIA